MSIWMNEWGEFCDDFDPYHKGIEVAPCGRKEPTGSGVPKRVRCVETGELYESQAAANRAFGKNPNGGSIGCAAKTGGTAYGCHWEYA